MGGLCSKRSAVDKWPSEGTLHFTEEESFHFAKKDANSMYSSTDGLGEKSLLEQASSFSERSKHSGGIVESNGPQLFRGPSDKFIPTKLRHTSSTANTGTRKVSEKSSLLGRASTAGLGKAVEVLDTLGSSMTSLHMGSGFASGAGVKGDKISILAFEVANTIVKGANLMQSLSQENIVRLKEDVLPSEGVHHLVSRDIDELLRIAANDKREELKVFSREVIRFGNRCKDPQWHNLDRYFNKLESELTSQNQLKGEAEAMIHQLMTLVQYTAELYHEFHALDRFEHDYRQKLQEEENPSAASKGDSLQMMRQELKSQRKHVKSLKKKSLWSKLLGEVMEKLVDIVHFLHLEIYEAFGIPDEVKPLKKYNNHQTLGSAGLALHYANIVTQIDAMVSRSCSVPQNSRDSLYQGLPPSIKGALRSKLTSFQANEELTAAQMKAEMERTLRWLVPIANNTTKAHHGFGWVGEWASTGTEVNLKSNGQAELIRIETLHHADKARTEAYILDLVVQLHHLISLTKSGASGMRSPIKSPLRSPTQKTTTTPPLSLCVANSSSGLTPEDQEMLLDVSFRRPTPGISKSQEFNVCMTKLSKHTRLSKSNSHLPVSGARARPSMRRSSMVPVIDFEFDKSKALDVIDRVDTIRQLSLS